jgi:subtilisin family serine protease
MNKTIGYLLVLSISAMLLIPSVASAPKVQLQDYTTWDIDMINSNETGFTGEGVYIAVLDTGLAPNWKDYFPQDQIAAELGKGFKEICVWDKKVGDFVETGKMVETTFIGDLGSTHGTHVTSTILGYNYYAPADALSGYPLPAIHIQGIAPDAIIIPIKVLADYQVPGSSGKVVFGTSDAVAAGINYATDLYLAGYSPMVITMSLGGPELSDVEKDAIDRAIDAGVIVVASAGNEGAEGMGYPGAYAPVISVGSCGWTKEWLNAEGNPFYRLWWLQSDFYDFNDVPEDSVALAEQVYISDFSSRELAGQELDIVAPGSWVRGPYPGVPGYSHLPWWSNGWGWYMGRNPGNFYYLGGTSMSAPHVTGIVAQMLEKNPSLLQSEVETILKTTALDILPGSADIWDYSAAATITWDSDATGAGLVQADLAVGAVP